MKPVWIVGITHNFLARFVRFGYRKIPGKRKVSHHTSIVEAVGMWACIRRGVAASVYAYLIMDGVHAVVREASESMFRLEMVDDPHGYLAGNMIPSAEVMA